MDEKIEINAFLNQLIAAVSRKFEVLDEEIKSVKREVEAIKQAQGKDEEPLKMLDSKIKNLEFSVNSMRNKNQVDRSMLKALESEKV